MCIVEPITEDTCSYFHLLTTKMQNEQHEFNVNWNKKSLFEFNCKTLDELNYTV